MSKIFIRFIYLQGFCEAAVSNAHLRWIGGDGWWFSGHWDITNTSEEEGLSPAKCGESRGNQGNRLQRWMAISNNIQSWITTSVLSGGNLWNLVIFWFWIFGLGLLFVTLGWLCFETLGETGKLLFGNILQFVAPHQALTDSEVWRAETVVTQPRYWEHWETCRHKIWLNTL